MTRWLTWPWIALYAIALLLLAAWYVPRMSADRYREPIRAALENALGRKVRLSSVQFRLLPVPGFTVDNVIVAEDPLVGSEPVAYVTTLRARPRLSALLGGRLEFASVDLEDTSVNVTRVERYGSGVRWNFSSLLRPKLLAAFPSIHMIGGRVNFKFGDTKSVLYLLNTDVDIWPPAESDGAWTLKVRAEPARTDRPAHGFGSFTARGQWLQKNSTLTVDVRLERSELGDMLTLVEGSEAVMHGHIWGDAHLAGPLSRVGIAGRVTIDDIHGWNQPPSPLRLTWPLSLSGSIDLPGQVAQLRATSGGGQSQFDLRYRVADYLAHPRWAVNSIFSHMPMSPLFGIARSMGWTIPPDLLLEGDAQGAVGYSMPDGVPSMNGEIRVANGSLAASGSPPLRMGDAQLLFAGSSVTLQPVTMVNSANQTATIEGSFNAGSRELAASIASDEMSIASLRRQISATGTPILSQATSGTWSGSLAFLKGIWRGNVHLNDADMSFEAFSQPLHIVSADAALDESGVDVTPLRLSIGGIPVDGEYRYERLAARSYQFKITVSQVSGEALEKLLMPTLHRGTFLNYAFNFGRVPEPDWMRNMHADGTVQVSTLSLGNRAFTKLKTRVLWDGDTVRFTGIHTQLGAALFSGDAAIDLADRQPWYQVNGRLSGLVWRSGTIDAEGTLTTSGTGAELLSNISAQGEIKGKDVNTWRTLDGCFDLSPNKLRVTDLVIGSGREMYVGTAESQQNGRVAIKASDGTKRIETTLDPLF